MRSLKIVVIDYNVGNTHSVSNAISFLGYNKLKISNNANVIKDSDVIILPGVGAFDEAIKNLRQRKLDLILNEQVLVKKKPILGICVGMQLMADGSEENGWHEGLGWISGNVRKLQLPKSFAVPHVGWNNVSFLKVDPMFSRNINRCHFYFDHSYWFDCDESNVAANTDYGIKLNAAIQCENIFGVQFHPEKSQTNGLKLFRGFFNSIS